MKNLGSMLKQAQEMQTKMAEMQERLSEVEIVGQAAAGMVRVIMTGTTAVPRSRPTPRRRWAS